MHKLAEMSREIRLQSIAKQDRKTAHLCVVLSPAAMEHLIARLVHSSEGVSTKVVTLGLGNRTLHRKAYLDEVGGKMLSAIGIKVGERLADRRAGDTGGDGASDDTSPSGLVLDEGVSERGVEEERSEVGISFISVANPIPLTVHEQHTH